MIFKFMNAYFINAFLLKQILVNLDVKITEQEVYRLITQTLKTLEQISQFEFDNITNTTLPDYPLTFALTENTTKIQTYLKTLQTLKFSSQQMFLNQKN